MGISVLEARPRESGQWTAAAIGHAGEILQGAYRRTDGVHRFLCSLPAAHFTSRAEVTATPGRALAVEPAWAWKALRAAQLLGRMSGAEMECRVRIRSNIPVGKGCGSSTADVMATLAALSRHLGFERDERALARLAVEAEGASDGSALGAPVLFRHREGVVDEELAGGFPPMRVRVVDARPGWQVATLGVARARYGERELARFAALREELLAAFAAGDAAAMGRIASESARMNDAYLPKPHLEETIRMVEQAGGYGVAAAHSGTVLALLFPPEERGAGGWRLAEQLARWGMPLLAGFRVS